MKKLTTSASSGDHFPDLMPFIIFEVKNLDTFYGFWSLTTQHQQHLKTGVVFSCQIMCKVGQITIRLMWRVGLLIVRN